MMKIALGLLLADVLALIYALAIPLHGQTRIDSNTQVSPRPSMVLADFAAFCTSPPGCTDLMFVRIKYANGATKPFILVPTSDPDFVPDGSWTRIPVILPPSTTAVPCSQTKP